MSNKVKTILAVIIFCVLFLDTTFLKGIIEKVSKVESVVSVEPVPSQESILLTKDTAEIITDKEDRATLAIFNLEFSKRLSSYSNVINTQQLQDIYVAAGANVYGKSIASKYQSLGAKLIALMKSILGEEEHIVSQEETELLSDVFRGLSFNLSN
jgi:hypothetical protein